MTDIKIILGKILNHIPQDQPKLRSDLKRIMRESNEQNQKVQYVKLHDLLMKEVGDTPEYIWGVKVWSEFSKVPVANILANLAEQGIHIENALSQEVVKLWIARDERYGEEDYEFLKPGKLHIFYDKPQIDRDPKHGHPVFTGARCIGEVPEYMYPQIKEGDCYEFNSDKLVCFEFRNI